MVNSRNSEEGAAKSVRARAPVVRRFEVSCTCHERRFIARVSFNCRVSAVWRFCAFVYLPREAFYRPCIRVRFARCVSPPVYSCGLSCGAFYRPCIRAGCRARRFTARVFARVVAWGVLPPAYPCTYRVRRFPARAPLPLFVSITFLLSHLEI